MAKLRSPGSAAHAASELGLPGGVLGVRALAVVELALGLLVLVAPGRVVAVACACLYAFFAILSARLVRRRAGCGCFGESDAPTSIVQVLTGAGFALVACASLARVPHGLGWLLARPASQWAVAALALAGAAYGVVLVYTSLPEAWSSWSGR